MRETTLLPDQSVNPEFSTPNLSNYRIRFYDFRWLLNSNNPLNKKYTEHIPKFSSTLADWENYIRFCTIDNLQATRRLSEIDDKPCSLITIGGRGGVGATALEHESARIILDTQANNTQTMRRPTFHATYDDVFQTSKAIGMVKPDSDGRPSSNPVLAMISEELGYQTSDQIKTVAGIGVVVVPGATWGKVEKGIDGLPPLKKVVRAFGEDFFNKLNNFLPPFSDIKESLFTHVLSVVVVAPPEVTEVLGVYRELLKHMGDNYDLANKIIQPVFNRKPFRNLEELIEAQEGATILHRKATEDAVQDVVKEFYRNGYLYGRISSSALRIIQLDVQDSESDLSATEKNNRIIETATGSYFTRAQKILTFISDSNPGSEEYNAKLAHIIKLIAYMEGEIVVNTANAQMGDFSGDGKGQALVKLVVENNFDLNQLNGKEQKIKELIHQFDIMV